METGCFCRWFLSISLMLPGQIVFAVFGALWEKGAGIVGGSEAKGTTGSI